MISQKQSTNRLNSTKGPSQKLILTIKGEYHMKAKISAKQMAKCLILYSMPTLYDGARAVVLRCNKIRFKTVINHWAFLFAGNTKM